MLVFKSVEHWQKRKHEATILTFTNAFFQVFFVLRKKQVQITFLHVYHHMIMVVGSWLGFKFAGGGHTVYFGLMNTAVHTVMYFYYLLAIYNPEYKKSIWWKKYITQMQLVGSTNTVIFLCSNGVDFSCNLWEFSLYTHHWTSRTNAVILNSFQYCLARSLLWWFTCLVNFIMVLILSRRKLLIIRNTHNVKNK